VSNADALLAKEMNSLSLDERERVFEDIHAIPRVSDEDPKCVEASLAEMAENLEKIKKKSAYDKAYFLSPGYVENPKFKLMFLRCENFDAKKAAVRFANHFERKLELFGSDMLVREIQFDDLTPDDRAALLSGSIQFLSVKDRSGRTVCCNAQKYHNYKHWTNHVRRVYAFTRFFLRYPTFLTHVLCIKMQMKVLWYLAMGNLADDEDIQRFGLVLVVYCVGPFKMAEIDREMMTHGMDYSHGLPLRYSALHYCFDDPRLRPVISFSKLIVDTSTRLRFRAHFGKIASSPRESR
jgi:hypothetical protein